jgi:hypothetical protein
MEKNPLILCSNSRATEKELNPYGPTPWRFLHIGQKVGSCSSSSAGVIWERGLPCHHGSVEVQAVTHSVRLNRMRRRIFLKTETCILPTIPFINFFKI